MQLLPNAPSVQLALTMKSPFIQKNSRKRERLIFFEKEDLVAGSWNCENASSDTAPDLDIGIMTEETGSITMLVQRSTLMPSETGVSHPLSALVSFFVDDFKEHGHQELKTSFSFTSELS